MNAYGVILFKLRQLNQLTMKQAAKKIGRSVGWLSEIENGRGKARLDAKEFERIVGCYGGEAHRKSFSGWVNKAQQASKGLKAPTRFAGSVIKYLRKKSGLTLNAAAQQVGISTSYLSSLENGLKALSKERRNQLLRIYGYKESSFRNFITEDKRAKNVPVEFKLNEVLTQMDSNDIEQVFHFALKLRSSQNPQTQTSAENAQERNPS